MEVAVEKLERITALEEGLRAIRDNQMSVWSMRTLAQKLLADQEKREHQQERPVMRTQVRGRRLRRLTADESAIWSAVLRGQAKWDGTYGLPVWTVQEPCDHRLHEGDPGYDPEQPEQEAWAQTVYGIRGDWLSLAHPLDLDVFCSQCGERAG